MFNLIFLFLSSFLYSLDECFRENTSEVDEIDILVHRTTNDMEMYSHKFGKSGSFKGFLNNCKSKLIGNFNQKKIRPFV